MASFFDPDKMNQIKQILSKAKSVIDGVDFKVTVNLLKSLKGEMDAFLIPLDELNQLESMLIQEVGLYKSDVDKILTEALFNTNFAFPSMAHFEIFLMQTARPTPKTYGIFEHNAKKIKYVKNHKTAKIVEQIKELNSKNSMGNVSIPNTGITLTNFSICPVCETVYSYKDVLDYFDQPKLIEGFHIDELREKETRIFCKHCNTFFLPLLLIENINRGFRDTYPLFSKCHTVYALEMFYLEMIGRKVLSLLSNNFRSGHSHRYIHLSNDTNILDLIGKPGTYLPCYTLSINDTTIGDLLGRKHSHEPNYTILINVIYYSNADILVNFIKGMNQRKNDPMFNITV
ncbi:MAG: hypothetical protein HQK77_19310 [Desulfobacterales bacterium]|nr:hypothetical protein [Desulfobacterales bacterium]